MSTKSAFQFDSFGTFNWKSKNLTKFHKLRFFLRFYLQIHINILVNWCGFGDGVCMNVHVWKRICGERERMWKIQQLHRWNFTYNTNTLASNTCTVDSCHFSVSLASLSPALSVTETYPWAKQKHQTVVCFWEINSVFVAVLVYLCVQGLFYLFSMNLWTKREYEKGEIIQYDLLRWLTVIGRN